MMCAFFMKKKYDLIPLISYNKKKYLGRIQQIYKKNIKNK